MAYLRPRLVPGLASLALWVPQHTPSPGDIHDYLLGATPSGAYQLRHLSGLREDLNALLTAHEGEHPILAALSDNAAPAGTGLRWECAAAWVEMTADGHASSSRGELPPELIEVAWHRLRGKLGTAATGEHLNSRHPTPLMARAAQVGWPLLYRVNTDPVPAGQSAGGAPITAIRIGSVHDLYLWPAPFTAP
ncbi:hypothetical protein BIV57_19185 [Mangrovactinospora gilvigrisea]|uniref:Uncharacterized protein n=1 Tax=Mangrovactinospora gilvigrisea TaxID=1428644 RepID=A0A1J7BB63_9ACTN|nr:hypothetical protein [Mangrovactinospora gilvigrisea]OIV35845.1 hypothetical protein BIV57_19185 [Mangrovactinospora gilvigrisea]